MIADRRSIDDHQSLVLPERERSRFPASQSSMSSFLSGERNCSAAVSRVIEEWARQLRAGELVCRD